MKKTIMAIMVVTCLFMCNNKITALAAQPYKYCPYCTVELETRKERLNGWSGTHVFTDILGASIECEEVCELYKYYKFCNNGHGVVQTYEVEEETHSVATCPSNKNK